ncbi:MAG: SpoIID/LytB domain-containing protein [Propionicimonas sp.]
MAHWTVMKTSSLTLRRVVVWALVIALLATMGLAAAAGTAQAAPKYTLTAKGCGTTTTAKACKITVTYKKGKTKVKKATAQLQYFDSKKNKWVNQGKKFTVKKGKGSVSVKHTSVTDRIYRVKVGSTTSASFKVSFVPATFTVKGSGFGHGAGMPQYGALGWLRANSGATYVDVLKHYYSAAALGTANNNPRTIKVQVLAPSRKTTTLSITSGGFTVKDGNGRTLATTKSKKPITIGVSGSKVTAKVTTADGGKKTVSAARLVLTWGSSATATVAGADGSYRYGNLQVTVLKKLPNVVNELRMNTEYLYGVSEMPSSWGRTTAGLQALKAQAVAARTYTIVQVSRVNEKFGSGAADPACDCQVVASTDNIHFTGWKKAGGEDNEYWRRAVDETMTATTVEIVRESAATGAGIAETTFYSATGKGSGFGTGNNADVFGTTALPYLASVADPYSATTAPASVNSWTKWPTVSQAKATSLFGGPVKNLAVTERYPGGLVKTITATLADGRTRPLTKTGTAWMRALGMQSPWITSITAR